MTNYQTLLAPQIEAIVNQLKTKLGENYCSWEVDFPYLVERISNDVTHLKVDNQTWYEKARELEAQLVNQATPPALAAEQTKVQELQNQLQAQAAELEQAKQTNQTSAAQLSKEIADLQAQIQTNQSNH